MNRRIGLVFFLLVVPVFYAFGNDDVAHSEEVSREMKRFSRHEGYKVAAELKGCVEWIDLPMVIEGIHDYIAGKQLQDVIDAREEPDYLRIMYQILEQEAQSNLQKACVFLDSLKSDNSVHFLENGKIAYQVLVDGSETKIVLKDSSPLLNYSISTLDGQEIATTCRGMGPLRIPLLETILGFAKGVEGMRIGEKRKIFIHPHFGYGKVGHVSPNSLLIAEVEVVAL